MQKVSVLLDEERDSDIIRWLDAQPNKSEALREAARLAMAPPLDAEDVRHVVREELQRVQITGAATREEQPSPEKLAAERKLDQMF